MHQTAWEQHLKERVNLGKETRQVIRREANSGMKWSSACQVYLCGINEDIHIFLEREHAQNGCDRHNENIVWERHDLKYLSAYLERAWPWQKFGEKTRLLPLLLLARHFDHVLSKAVTTFSPSSSIMIFNIQHSFSPKSCNPSCWQCAHHIALQYS